MPKTAVAYARYSTAMQRGESIDAQLRAIHSYADKNDIEIIRVYIDRAETATDDDRPDFRRMIAELPEIKPDFVLTHKFDRFARSRYDSAIHKRAIQQAGARYIAVDQPIDDTPEGVILESVLEGMAEYYSKNLAREVMKGMKENAYKAQFNGGWVPLGYDIDENKHYVINEAEAEAIRLIFAMKLAGGSYGQIADELNNRGHKTKRNRAFGKNSIHEILRNEKYCGVYVFNETPKRIAGKRNNRVKKPDDEIIRVEGAVPAIISRSNWEQVQIMMDNKKRTRSATNTIYMLAGILRCGECGSAMIGQSSFKNRNGERQYSYYYVCNKAKRTGECSCKKQYRKDKLENDVLDIIEKHKTRIKNIPAMIDKLWDEVQKVNAGKDHETIQLEKQLKEVGKVLANYTKAIEKGAAIDLIIDNLNEAGRQKKYILSRLEEKRSPFEDVTKQDIVDYWEAMQAINIDRDNPEECKKIVADCVQSATIRGKFLEVIIQHHLGGAVYHGVGGPTLTEPHCIAL